jgi:hypothetical protein
MELRPEPGFSALIIKVRVSRVSDDGEKFTIEVAGQRYTGTRVGLEIVKQEKGPNWPT